MSGTQVNIRTSPTLLKEIDLIVDNGMFRNRTEAVNEALRLLIRRYRIIKIAEQIRELATNEQGRSNLTDLLLGSREEEDL